MTEEQSSTVFSVCTYPECGRPLLAKGLCQTHYSMQRRGEPLRAIKYQHKPWANKFCAFDGCGLYARAKGLCPSHREQQKIGIELKPLGPGARNRDKICEFPECPRPVAGIGYCQGHYRQKRLGKQLQPLHIPTYRYKHAGYILLQRPDHPNASKQGKVFEHVVVMSEALGRPLLESETIHHKNGIKDDNRPENLELKAGRHAKGQAVTDLLAYARDILSVYGTEAEKKAIEGS